MSKRKKKKEAVPLIIQYTNLLHKYGDPGASAVTAFVERHKSNGVFVRRVKTLNALFLRKEAYS